MTTTTDNAGEQPRAEPPAPKPDLPLQPHGSVSVAIQLVATGFISLFLELTLIRYLPSQVWNLGYFPNLVLISAFLGLGFGFAIRHRLRDSFSRFAFAAFPILLLGLILFLELIPVAVPGFSEAEGLFSGEAFFSSTPTASTHVSWLPPFIGCFVGVALLFWTIGQWAGGLFRHFQPLTAYSLDIAGSCAGVLAFMAVSWFQLPAYSWFLLLIPAGLFCARQTGPTLLLICAGLIATSAFVYSQDQALTYYPNIDSNIDVQWSPYQKVEYAGGGRNNAAVFVNGILHQGLWNAATLRTKFYDRPYRMRDELKLPPPTRVLILGAGTGNDAAVALLNGAEVVDAVEIDPVILRLGQEYHPEFPYGDPRVRTIVDDGRAVLSNTTARYDMIVFALTDSLVKISPVGQLRLENYLFTKQAVARAFSLLEPDGQLVFYNAYRRPWINSKIRSLLQTTTNGDVQEWSDREFSILTSAKTAPAQPESVAQSSSSNDVAPAIPTDNWPFLYLREPSIPPHYTLGGSIIALCLLTLGCLLRFDGRKGSKKSSLPLSLGFAAMGSAFLLLETKSLIQFSLLFGTTWYNASFVFLAVLLLVLAANWVAQLWHQRLREHVVLVLLFASCCLPFVISLDSLLHVTDTTTRALAASLLVFSPIFFANLLFSLVFREKKNAAELFGWNILGACVGGVLEYASMAVGYQALAVAVIVLYVAAFGAFALHERWHPANASS